MNLSEYNKQNEDLLALYFEQLESIISKYKLDPIFLSQLKELDKKTANYQGKILVIGEASSGKTSFIEALLKSMNNSHLCQDSFNILDTSGSLENNKDIIQANLADTKLVYVVLNGKNPFGQSIWSFLDEINIDWRHKFVFIIQQSDLIKANDLEQITNYIKDTAKKHNFSTSPVFAVSANKELDNLAESGFGELINHVGQLLDKENPQASIDNLKIITKQIHKELLSISDANLGENENTLLTKADKQINKILNDFEADNNNIVAKYVEGYPAIQDESSTRVKEITYGDARYEVLQSSSTVRKWFDEQEYKFEHRVEDYVGQFTNEISDNLKLINKRSIDNLTRLNDDDLKFNRKTLYTELEEKEDSIINTIKEKSSKLHINNDIFRAVAKKYGEKTEKVFKRHQLYVWLITFSPIILYLIPKVISFFSNIIALFIDKSEDDAESTINAINLLSSLDKQPPKPMNIIIAILSTILLMMILRLVAKYFMKKRAIGQMENLMHDAYDDYKKNEPAISASFKQNMYSFVEATNQLVRNQYANFWHAFTRDNPISEAVYVDQNDLNKLSEMQNKLSQLSS